MKNKIKTIGELRNFLVLWSTQALSALGSSMTNFALVIWSYQQTGSALSTAMLAVCSYLPYVLVSIFAGTLTDRWNKKFTLLVSDGFAALCTVTVLVLLQTGGLALWHLYGLNALNGLMNTIQQPASDVSVSLLAPKKHYQKVGGLRTFSNSLVTVLTPVIASALLSFTSVRVVIAVDLATFALAFLALLFLVRIPEVKREEGEREPVLRAAREGVKYLKQHRGVLDLILFLAAINLTASMYNAALPAMLLSRTGGGEGAVGIVNTATGIAMLLGSIFASLAPAPRSRVRVICNTLLLSMSTENFILAFGRNVPVWCLGAVMGWICIPIMSTNMDVLLRGYIPIDIQGRVYSARNTLQFFTIPVGYLLGGVLVDRVFEPFMKAQPPKGVLASLFGVGKGSGTALFFFCIGFIGILTCLTFRRSPHIWKLEGGSRLRAEASSIEGCGEG